MPKGPNTTCQVFLWSSQQSFFQPVQAIPFPGLSSVHAFTPLSGIRMSYFYTLQCFTCCHTVCIVAMSTPDITVIQHTNSVYVFLAHLLLAGTNDSTLYMWKPELTQFTKVLQSSPAQTFLYLSVLSLNVTKSLIIATEGLDSVIYELISVSNQSDFIPR